MFIYYCIKTLLLDVKMCLQLCRCSGIMDKVCAFCSRGEKSLLGQGELTCYEPTPGFNPFKRQLSRTSAKRALSETDEIGSRRGQQSLTWRRTRGLLRQQSRWTSNSFVLITLNQNINTFCILNSLTVHCVLVYYSQNITMTIYCAIILCLLLFCRLYLHIDFILILC